MMYFEVVLYNRGFKVEMTASDDKYLVNQELLNHRFTSLLT